MSALGRNHWPWIYLCAGGGFGGGRVHGTSDRSGGRPASRPVSPADFAATLYHFLGINLASEIHDPQRRPYQLCEGRPITDFARS